MSLGEALYKASQEGGQENTSSEIEEGDSSKMDTSDAVDAEFEEVEEEKDKKKE